MKFYLIRIFDIDNLLVEELNNKLRLFQLEYNNRQ